MNRQLEDTREDEIKQEDEIYRENILDHYRNPHNSRLLKDPDISHLELNPLCGDQIHLFLKIQNSSIHDAAFQGIGCAISQASASMLTDRIKGMTVDHARRMGREDIIAMLGIPISTVRMKCALLSLKALQNGIEEWRNHYGT